MLFVKYPVRVSLLLVLLCAVPQSILAQGPTILDTDSEFDAGSGMTITSLTAQQTENLYILGKVWGFLKYHHPDVAAGDVHWDYELFRVLPDVLDANTSDARNEALSTWLTRIGIPESCNPCAKPPKDVHLHPDLDWLDDDQLISETVSSQLQQVFENRFAGDAHFYIDHAPNVGNPIFKNELPYEHMADDDAGMRILALYRKWNMIEYWFPYRDVIDEDWDDVLIEFLPRIVATTDRDTYRLELLAFVSTIKDTHVNLWRELDVLPPRGECYLPVHFRFIEGQLTVTGYNNQEEGNASVLQIGDVVQSLDGMPVSQLVEERAPYYSASNQPTRLRNMARYFGRGNCEESTLSIDRNGAKEEVTVPRSQTTLQRVTNDRPGDTFQLLSPDVAYIKLSSIASSDLNDYLERAKNTKGLVIDIRNYPSEFVVFSLGTRLVQESTPFTRFTQGDLHNPGAFTWTDPISLQPASNRYEGKIAILIDETSQSQSEYTTMAFRSAPDATVIGSTTAGADGNVSRIILPGNIGSLISGIGVFYPDKTPTQRVGIIPDIEARPTIEGIRQGRDEVLETAIHHILGDNQDQETIIKMAKPNP